MNIVIVDDEIASLNTFLGNVVDRSDLHYTMFKDNPQLVVDFVLKNDIDGAFLDICMPNLDGVELAKQLINAKPNILVAFISGYSQEEDKIKQQLGKNLVGFCYKPYSEKQLNYFIIKMKTLLTNSINIKFGTFPSFQMYLSNIKVEFEYSKVKETLALLVDRHGEDVSIKEFNTHIYPDKDYTRASYCYRDIVCKLRLFLNRYNLDDLVDFKRGSLSLNTDGVFCDAWVYENDVTNIDFMGEYMHEYEWANDKEIYFDALLYKKMNILKK